MPPAKETGRLERATVWAMLRNPGHKGTACFGKTRIAPRMRVTRPLLLRGGVAPRNSANHELFRTEWIETAVPTIISEETFAFANELLEPTRSMPSDARSRRAPCKDC
ncbi:recombinase family protein [Bradyrhizobium sp. USDA 4515]